MVALCVTSITSGLALLWLAVTYRHLVIWAVTLGENFWGGLAVSVLGVSVAAWAIFTIVLLNDEEQLRTITKLKAVAVLGMTLAVLAHCSAFWLWINGDFGDLSLLHLGALFLLPGWGVVYLVYRGYAAIMGVH